jgi:curved DNA-binding protein CbpA
MKQSPTPFQIEYGLFQLDFPDYHAVLGIPIGADANQVRKKYLKIAYSLHPDTCKAKSDAEKEQASQILSKLVNPAYENLYKKNLRVEYQLILSQMGRRLSMEGNLDNTSLVSEEAKKLAQSVAQLELVYKKLLEDLTSHQYESLNSIIETIGKISELNLVYLTLSKTQEIKQEPIIFKVNEVVIKPKETTPSNDNKQEQQKNNSPVESYIRRAQEYIDRQNYTKAITELRDALQLDPNNSTCHSLMGLAYLKDKKLGMAKVHINKAWSLNPKDPIVVQSKQELDKLNSAENPSKSSSNPPKWKFW